MERSERRNLASNNDLSGRSLAVLTKPTLSVLGVNLECQSLPLHQQIVERVYPLIDQGVTTVNILPLFLSPGVHVCEDLPAEIRQAQLSLATSCRLKTLPYLGSSPLLIPWLEQCFWQYQTRPQAQRILLAHGSRRPGGNRAIAQVAQRLNAQVTFWKTEPSLDQVLSQFPSPAQVVILPYFLFAGGTTDAIQTKTQQLQQQHPGLNLKLGEPLGPNPMLARLIATVFRQG
jgi:sirohydrochlorin ferrochelatase